MITDERRARIDTEIATARNDIRTDKLDISYGEIANLYENSELIIRPAYQRLFRWLPTQKSRFIESILLGFPTPAIFVAEDERGIWELVDGLQRISTVLEFMGVLRGENDEIVPPSTLTTTGHKPRLRSIDGVAFDDLSLQARLSIKRAGCRVEVIKVGSQPGMKYEVFERLNTGGSSLTHQEVRNCIFRATNPEFVEWVEHLASFKPFKDNLNLTEYQENSMFDRGLILRYLTMKNAYRDFEHDVEPFITDYIKEVLEGEREFDQTKEDEIFHQTFEKIGEALGEDAWRHFRDGRHRGPLSVYIFEALSVGIAHNLATVRRLSPEQLRDRVIEFKQRPEFTANTGAGANIKSKLLARIDFALSFFAEV